MHNKKGKAPRRDYETTAMNMERERWWEWFEREGKEVIGKPGYKRLQRFAANSKNIVMRNTSCRCKHFQAR